MRKCAFNNFNKIVCKKMKENLDGHLDLPIYVAWLATSQAYLCMYFILIKVYIKNVNLLTYS